MASTAPKPRIYCFGRFRLDAPQRILYRDGGVVSLTPKAIDLLIVLVERSGEWVDKESLLQAVWPGTFIVESSLTKNVSVLRKALDDPDAAESLIETASKRGYRFVAAVRKQPVSAPFVFRHKRVAVLVAIALLATLVSYLRTRHSAGPTSMSDAERSYRIGGYLWDKMDRTQMLKALEQFQRAAELDPNSAPAHAGVANAYVMMATMGLGQEANLSRAREAASRALALDPGLALPHVSLGWVRLMVDFNPRDAEREYSLALTLDPKSVIARHAYASLLSHAGRLQEARVQIAQAQELDPASPLLGTGAGRIEYYARRYQHAIQLLRDVLDREPSFTSAHYYLAMALGQLGRTSEALEHLHQAKPHASLRATEEAWLQSVAGNRDAARRLIAERRGLVATGRAKSVVLVMPAIDAGDYALALDSLEDMWHSRQIEVLIIKVSPRFDTLRGEPRFEALVRRVWPEK